MLGYIALKDGEAVLCALPTMARLQPRVCGRRHRVLTAVWAHGAGHGGLLPGHCNGQSLPCGSISLLDAIGLPLTVPYGVQHSERARG